MSETYEYQAWPQWLYTVDGRAQIFACEADIPADEGWLSLDDLEKHATIRPGLRPHIPADWPSSHWKTQAVLAKAISGVEPANTADAKAVIAAEVERRKAA